MSTIEDLERIVQELKDRVTALEKHAGLVSSKPKLKLINPPRIASQIKLKSKGGLSGNQRSANTENLVYAEVLDAGDWEVLSCDLVRRDEIDNLRAEFGKTAGALRTLQEQFQATEKDALFLSNVAYAYALMAYHWQQARERVYRISQEQTTSDTLKKVAWGLFIGGLQLGFAAATGGIATTLYHAFGAPVVAVLGKLVAGALKYRDTVDSEGESKRVARSGQEKDDISGDVGKDIYSPVAGKLFDSVAEKIWGGESENQDALMDPYEFFLDCEKSVREMAASLCNARQKLDYKNSYHKEVANVFANDINPAANLDDMKADPFWGFMFAPLAKDDYEKKWKTVSGLLAIQMRRLAWRTYCRSRWDGNEYVVKLDYNRANDWKGESNASEFHYKAWQETPRHWGELCNDFRGSEHIPNHPMHEGDKAKIDKAKKLETKHAHISLAVVQCCKVTISTGMVTSLKIDIEQLHGNAGELLKTKNEENLKSYDSRYSADQIKITKVRFGSGESYGRATGKKGMLTDSNSNDDDHMPRVNGGMKITVDLVSTKWTGVSAYVRVAKLDKPTGEIKRDKHGNVVDPVSWKKEYHFRSTYVNLMAPLTAGKYCVTLDRRDDKLRTEKVRFIASEWWFEVI